MKFVVMKKYDLIFCKSDLLVKKTVKNLVRTVYSNSSLCPVSLVVKMFFSSEYREGTSQMRAL